MIIGRIREQEFLERAFNEKRNRFITVYGRRRIGKTYLINEFFKKKKCVYFHITGIRNGSMRDQLENFARELSQTFLKGFTIKASASWKDAFQLLTAQLRLTKKKVVIFFDELPRLTTQPSKLLDEIGYAWNKEWLNFNNITFIACGSSASWMIKKVIRDKGGLHNRTNVELNLLPFDLYETKEYLTYRHVTLADSHILSLYLAIGGIPYYLDYISPKLTAQQNIQNLFFGRNAALSGEFTKLFESLFNEADDYIELIEIIAQKRYGISLPELGKASSLSATGGTLLTKLQQLCDTGFIQKVVPWGKVIGAYYKVIDEFCLFYLSWVKSAPLMPIPEYWLQISRSPQYHAWSGYAFEAVCAKHSLQILRALKISHAQSIASWRYLPKTKNDQGAQIDLVFVRSDDAITLCEIKYTNNPFVIDKHYANVLRTKHAIFKKQTKTPKQVFFAIVSAQGIKKTLYSEELISRVVTLKDLFVPYGWDYEHALE